MPQLQKKDIVLAVSGSVSAYKAAELCRLLVAAGGAVHPMLTRGAERFIGALTLSSLSGRPAITNLWEAAATGHVGHVELAHQAALVVIAPATADTLARLVQGRADDPLGALVLSTRAPILVAPAMETHMWEHPTTQAHVRALEERGLLFVMPEDGPLASGRQGMGRLADPTTIFEAVCAALMPQTWAHHDVLVTAGPTQEAFDPARFVSNGSSGKMGFALAGAARRRGARVHLISGPTQLADPWGVTVERIVTARELLNACRAAMAKCTVFMMAAAPADFAPAFVPYKIKKSVMPTQLELQPTADVLKTLDARAPTRFVVGFAAETENLLERGQAKLLDKNLDMLIANIIGPKDRGFAANTNSACIISRHSQPLELPLMPKTALAEIIVDRVAAAMAEAR